MSGIWHGIMAERLCVHCLVRSKQFARWNWHGYAWWLTEQAAGLSIRCYLRSLGKWERSGILRSGVKRCLELFNFSQSGPYPHILLSWRRRVIPKIISKGCVCSMLTLTPVHKLPLKICRLLKYRVLYYLSSETLTKEGQAARSYKLFSAQVKAILRVGDALLACMKEGVSGAGLLVNVSRMGHAGKEWLQICW